MGHPSNTPNCDHCTLLTVHTQSHKTVKMLKFVLGIAVISFAVAIQVYALQCFQCEGTTGAGGCNTPGGPKTNSTCPPNSKFCEFKSVNGKPQLKGCANITSYPSGYQAVGKGQSKKCKVTSGRNETHCYCNVNKCNNDGKPIKGPGGGVATPQAGAVLVGVLAGAHVWAKLFVV